MPRRTQQLHTSRRSKANENPLGEESVDHTTEYESPSSDPEQSSYSIGGRQSRRSRQNTSSRVPADMDLTNAANRSTRASVGPNRSADRPRPGPASAQNRSRSIGASQSQNRSRSPPPVRNRPGPAHTKRNIRKQRKPRHLKPGVAALREIRHLQATTHMLIPKLPFSRVVRETMQNCSRTPDLRTTREALMALQEATELYLVHFFEDSIRLTAHAKRVTLMPADMKLVTYLRGNWNQL